MFRAYPRVSVDLTTTEVISVLFGMLNPVKARGRPILLEFEEFIAELDRAYRREANIFIFGNGGSAATASHFACDMNKGVGHGKDKKFKVMCLNDNLPTLLAYANDVSYEDVFVEQLKNFMGEGDLVVGISGSGNSENVVR